MSEIESFDMDPEVSSTNTRSKGVAEQLTLYEKLDSETLQKRPTHPTGQVHDGAAVELAGGHSPPFKQLQEAQVAPAKSAWHAHVYDPLVLSHDNVRLAAQACVPRAHSSMSMHAVPLCS